MEGEEVPRETLPDQLAIPTTAQVESNEDDSVWADDQLDAAGETAVGSNPCSTNDAGRRRRNVILSVLKTIGMEMNCLKDICDLSEIQNSTAGCRKASLDPTIVNRIGDCSVCPPSGFARPGPAVHPSWLVDGLGIPFNRAGG
jgi:hypothetical protein